MPRYPLLELESAWRDALSNIDDMAGCIADMQAKSDGHWPPEAAQVLETIAQAWALLAQAIPPALREAIDKEKQQYDEDDA